MATSTVPHALVLSLKVSHDLVHEISIQDTAGSGGGVGVT